MIPEISSFQWPPFRGADHQSQILIDKCLAKIRSEAANESLHTKPHLLSLLYRWKEWTQTPNEIAEWIESLTNSVEKFKDFLVSIVSVTRSQGSGAVKTQYRIRYTTLQDFINPDSLRSSIEAVVKSDLVTDPQIESVLTALLREIDDPEQRKDPWF